MLFRRLFDWLAFGPHRYDPMYRPTLFNLLTQFWVKTDKEKTLEIAFDYCLYNTVEGAYYEFGTSNGDSALYSLNIKKSKGIKSESYLFDSFEGLPQPIGIDQEHHFYKGQYSCLIETFNQRLKGHKYTAIKGWFKDTLKNPENYPKANVILIDCDLYASAKPVFKFIRPLLQQGTVIIIDDYHCYKSRIDRGLRKAWEEFKWENPEYTYVKYKNFTAGGETWITQKLTNQN